MHITHKAGLTLALLTAFGCSRSQAQTFTAAPNPAQSGYVDQGFYRSDGEHDPKNNNYAVGQVAFGPGKPLFPNNPVHNFFTFDLSGLNLTGLQVTSASLVLQRFSSESDSGMTNFQYALSGVTTGAAALNAINGGVAVYTDLGDGPSYGTFSVPVAALSTDMLTASLNATAIGAIQSGAGGFFSIGGSLLGLPDAGTELLFGGSNGTNTDGHGPPQELIITTAAVPEASAAVSLAMLLGLGMGAAVVSTRRRTMRRSK